MESEEEKIEELLTLKAFLVKPEGAKDKKEKKWNAFNTGPDPERFGEAASQKWMHEMACEYAGDGTVEGFEKLYYHTPASEVWRRLARKRAMQL